MVLSWLLVPEWMLSLSARTSLLLQEPMEAGFDDSFRSIFLDSYWSDFFTAFPFSKAGVKAGTELHLSQGSKVNSGHLPVDLGQCWVETELHLEIGGQGIAVLEVNLQLPLYSNSMVFPFPCL